MPAIIDYAAVQTRMAAAGLVCNYHNSGAFGFPRGAVESPALIRGWIGPPDATIRAALAASVQSVPPPWEQNLANSAARVWQSALAEPAWVLPMSHWHFELHDGSRDWLPRELEKIGVDPRLLENRADGAAIEFDLRESAALVSLLAALLSNLRVSDFLLAFPARPAVCMVHHHKQLWWQTTDARLIASLDAALK